MEPRPGYRLSKLLEQALHSKGRRVSKSYADKLAPILNIASSRFASNGTDGKSARAAVLVFFVRVISAVLAFMLQVFLARWMGSEQYGIFVLVWVVTTMMGCICCLGLQTAVIRFITEYRAKNDLRRLDGILLAAPAIVVLVSVTASLLAFTVLFFIGDTVTATNLLPLYIALICLPLLALEEIQEGIARSFDMPLTAIGPAFIVRPLGILITMTFALLLGFQADAVTALSSAVVATATATLIQSLTLWLKISKHHAIKIPFLSLMNLSRGNRTGREFQFTYWISIALPIFLASGFYGILFNSDVVLIGLILGPDAVAYYYAALKSLALVHFVLYAFRAACTHHFSRFYSENKFQDLSDYANKIARWTFWPTLAIAVIMVLTGKYILMLFGSEFVEGQNLLIILALGIVVRASIGPIDALLAMTGQQSLAMWVLAITLLSNIILNVSLIPQYGILGAAIATSCAMFIETASLYIAVSRKLGIRVFILHFSGETIGEGYAA